VALASMAQMPPWGVSASINLVLKNDMRG